MRLISLNTWGGKRREELISFLIDESTNTDLFCLQEVYDLHDEPRKSQMSKDGISTDLYKRIWHALSGFDSTITEEYTSLGERMAIFSAMNINIVKEGVVELSEKTKMPIGGGKSVDGTATLQWIRFFRAGKKFTIATVHGFWIKNNKEDSPERIEQSHRILKFLNEIDGAKILCGDFNLAPNTQSIQMLEKEFRNLIKEYNIKATRSSFTPKEKGLFADYVFVSPEVNVTDFKVLRDEVSDHLPLMLEFD